MKKTNIIIGTLLILMMINAAVSQTNPAKTIDLLAGIPESDELPEGWSSSNCTQAKIQMGELFLERDSPGDTCIARFDGQMPDGTYTVSATSYFDGYNPKIFLGGKDISEKIEVKTVNGRISIIIHVKGDGKVWGNIYTLNLTKKVIPKPKQKSKPKKRS